MIRETVYTHLSKMGANIALSEWVRDYEDSVDITITGGGEMQNVVLDEVCCAYLD